MYTMRVNVTFSNTADLAIQADNLNNLSKRKVDKRCPV